MKITEQQLNRIVKEELHGVLSEKYAGRMNTLNNIIGLISDVQHRVEVIEAKLGIEKSAPPVTELPDMGRVKDW